MSSTLSLCCLCTDTGTHQGSLQPQSYCAHQCLAPVRREEGVGPRPQNAGVGRSRTAPCRPGANLQVSQGNERSDLATAARSSGAAHAFSPGPAGTGPDGPPPPRPPPLAETPPRGGARVAIPGILLRLGGFLRTPGGRAGALCTWVAAAQGSAPRAAKNFPWSLGGLGAPVLWLPVARRSSDARLFKTFGRSGVRSPWQGVRGRRA